jgi:hypothetical protein
MDKYDPSIDYLKIDEMISCREYDSLVEYCDYLGCECRDVIGVWFDAVCPDGLLMGGYYFEKVHHIDIPQDSFDLGSVMGLSQKFPTKQQMNLSAESFMQIPYKEFTSMNPIECLSRYFIGDGYVTSFVIGEYWSAKQASLLKTRVTVSMNKWALVGEGCSFV